MKLANPLDRNLVIDILTKSFDQNRSVNYVAKQDKMRLSRIQGLMEYSFDVCSAFGKVWVSENNQACALVLFPDQKRTTLRTIYWDLKLAIKVISIGRVFDVLDREGMIKKNHPNSPMSYLWFIGVEPQNQSKGTGSHLLLEILAESEKMNRPVYLETSVERNISWYEKFGFKIYNSIDLTYKLYLLRNKD